MRKPRCYLVATSCRFQFIIITDLNNYISKFCILLDIFHTFKVRYYLMLRFSSFKPKYATFRGMRNKKIRNNSAGLLCYCFRVVFEKQMCTTLETHLMLVYLFLFMHCTSPKHTPSTQHPHQSMGPYNNDFRLHYVTVR